MSTSPLPFRKYHGIGNDFLVVDALTAGFLTDRLLDLRVVRHICDRHLGVGADGILVVLPPVSTEAQARMQVLNADGSEAEMCGNGIRCVAKFLHDHLPQFREARQIALDTGAGLLHCGLSFGDDGLVSSVRVDMGSPGLDRAALPMEGQGTFIDEPLAAGEGEMRFTAVSMGNPHLVTFLDASQSPRELAATLGPRLEHHPAFPRRTNVEFARPSSDGLELWVWERGCGITMACGTGACATAVAAVITGRHRAPSPLQIHLPGGALTITVAEDLSRVWMEGPAVEVFRGELDLEGLTRKDT
jgi:diaminopimelate epimerase